MRLEEYGHSKGGKVLWSASNEPSRSSSRSKVADPLRTRCLAPPHNGETLDAQRAGRNTGMMTRSSSALFCLALHSTIKYVPAGLRARNRPTQRESHDSRIDRSMSYLSSLARPSASAALDAASFAMRFPRSNASLTSRASSQASASSAFSRRRATSSSEVLARSSFTSFSSSWCFGG